MPPTDCKGVQDGATNTMQTIWSVSRIVYDDQNRMTLLVTIVFVVLSNCESSAHDLLNLFSHPIRQRSVLLLSSLNRWQHIVYSSPCTIMMDRWAKDIDGRQFIVIGILVEQHVGY